MGKGRITFQAFEAQDSSFKGFECRATEFALSEALAKDYNSGQVPSGTQTERD
jgi:hypothetical protein